MKVTSETVATREVELTIEPDERTVQRAMRKAARQVSRWRPVSGYRPGRAPYAMVERIFGRDVILNEALNDIAQEVYRQAIEEADISPYQQGQLDVESEEPLVLKVRVPLVPVVHLPDLTELSIEPEPEVSLTAEQIDGEIEIVRRRNAEYEPVERPVEMGDQITATIKGIADEEEVIDREDVTLLLNDELPPPGFAEALIGMNAEETREFSLAYPEDYVEENLAGKTVDLTVTVATIRQVNLPEIDDDLAKTAGDYETVDQMRDGLAERLKARLETEARRREGDAAIALLVERSEVEYPAAALNDEVENAINSQRQRIERIGYSFENYLQMTGQTLADLREEITPAATDSLIRRLVLTQFAREQEVSVSDQELGGALASYAAMYGQRAEEVMAQMRESGAVMNLYADLVTDKAVARLTDMLTGRDEEKGNEEKVDDEASDDVESTQWEVEPGTIDAEGDADADVEEAPSQETAEPDSEIADDGNA